MPGPRNWLAVLVLLPGLAAAADLLEVFAQARASDPVLAAAEAARGVVREGVAQARAPLLPQWTMAMLYQRQHEDPKRLRELTSNISQVLLDFNKTASLRSAQARSEAQEALLQSTRQALAVRVATAYFGVLSASDGLATVQANEDAFARQVQQAQARLEAGLGAQVDIEQARTYHALARANTITARKSLTEANQALIEITGQQPGRLRPLGEALPLQPPAPADPQAWLTDALRDNPALRAEQRSLDASEQSLDAARAAHLPTLTLNVDSSRLNEWPVATDSSATGRVETAVGVTLNVPLFAGGATESLRRQAVYQREGARETLEQRRRQIAREIQERYAAVLTGIAQIEATGSAVDAARKALAATQAGQELGTRSMTDLLLAIQNQASARNAYSQARHQYVLNRLQLLQSAGHIDDTQLAAINALLLP